MKKIIETAHAPKAIGAYSQACQAGGTLFVSGQIGLHPESGELVSEETREQLERAILNLKAILQAAHTDLQHVVKLTVYLTNITRDFPIVNELVDKYFKPEYPARAVVEVSALPKGSQVEIDAIAFLD